MIVSRPSLYIPKAGGGGGGGIDPATLALTLYVKAGDYDGSTTWTGTASAGTSGSHNLTAHGTPVPGNGATLDGHTTINFNGAFFGGYFNTAVNATSIISTTAWSAWCLVNLVNESDDDNIAGYNDDAVFYDASENCGLAVRNGSVHGDGPHALAVVYFGGNHAANSPIANGAWQVIQGRFDGTNVECRTNNGAWTVVGPVGGTPGLGGVFNVGTASTFRCLDGDMAQLLVSQTRFDDATFDGVYQHLKALYPSAGLP